MWIMSWLGGDKKGHNLFPTASGNNWASGTDWGTDFTRLLMRKKRYLTGKLNLSVEIKSKLFWHGKTLKGLSSYLCSGNQNKPSIQIWRWVSEGKCWQKPPATNNIFKTNSTTASLVNSLIIASFAFLQCSFRGIAAYRLSLNYMKKTSLIKYFSKCMKSCFICVLLWLHQ